VHGGELIGRPEPDFGFKAPPETNNNITVSISGPFTGPVTVTGQGDEQRLAQTIRSEIEEGLLSSLERLLGQGTPFPHGLHQNA
jgi:hypothetical protein